MHLVIDQGNPKDISQKKNDFVLRIINLRSSDVTINSSNLLYDACYKTLPDQTE